MAVPGCDRVVFPQKLTNMPNTFRPELLSLWGEKVIKVEVWKTKEDGSGPSTLVWQINANEDIPARGFAVTAGEVPDGFVQVTPSSSEVFSVEPGKEYAIVIYTNRSCCHSMGTYWIAESAKGVGNIKAGE
jgi:hypothetical protein